MKAKFLFFFLFIIFYACRDNQVIAPAYKSEKHASSALTTSKVTDLKYTFEQLDNTKGLSNSSVNCIFQDSQNIMWMGTWDGLNRFDGTNFKIFRPEPDNRNSISNQVVLKIGDDKAGQIWVLTMHGIDCYNKKTGKFKHHNFSRENEPPVSESQFNIAFDASKSVFCSVQNWGIGYFDGTKFQRLNNSALPSKTVKKLDCAGTGNVLVLYDDNTLYSLNIVTSLNGTKAVNRVIQLQNEVSTFEVLTDKKVCVVSTKGQAALLSLNGSKNMTLLPEGNVASIVGHIREGVILADKSDFILIDNTGTNIKKPWLQYLKGHKIASIYCSSENIIWAGTDGDGLLKIYPLKKSFNLVSGLQIPELNGGIVRSFLKDSTGAFWLGTKGKGLFRLPGDFYMHPEKKPKYSHFDESNSNINSSVYALYSGRDNLNFIGTDGEGLAVYDLKSNKLYNWKEIDGNNICNYFRSVYSIYQDKQGVLWLGTNGYGMISCKVERINGEIKISDFKQYKAGGKNSLSSNIIFSILPKDNNKLWVGTRLGGLNLFDKASGKFKLYKNIPGDTKSLSNNDILCLVNDSQNQLWVGTSFGLNVLKELKSNGEAVFKSYTVKDGLPNNTVHGIVPENYNLWISTNFGLANFDITHSKFSNYNKNEGLQNNEFADGAYYKDLASGYIFMGGIKGFNYFLPEKIKESPMIPDLLIDEISGHNQTIPYYQGLVVATNSKKYPSIKLKHDQNFFDIHLKALTYTNPEKCRYAYQLQGFDKEWNNIGNRQVISFTNVPKGKYSLWLKWTNSEGIWNKPVHAVDIAVQAVWWQSNLALVIYAALAAILIFFVHSYNVKRRSLKQNILIREKEEELHENRLTFFTNIAHEFLTPLTLIVGPAQKLSETATLDGKYRKAINMIQRNSSRLLFLTQQLLEFRKAEYDYLENTVKNFDLVGLLEQIAELFDDWALDKHINYKLDIPPVLPGWFDKDKVEKIIFNLMSNAFKYTPANGNVYLQCSIEGEEFKTLNITIRNTGKGIPKEKLESLFDRFFLSDTNEKSDTEMFRTGIGLAYVKRLVTVLRGEIKVVSIPDAETVFTVLIPCEKAAFAEKEIDAATTPVFISQHLKNILEEKPDKPEPVPEKISAIDTLENHKKLILVVEDENEIHSYLNDLLADKYKLLTAYNGAEALEIMEHEVPDLIISDVMMPVMDGVELCKKVKTDLHTCHIPFIMLTAKNTIIHRIEGLESGANSYIPKPFYPDHLLVRIQKLLEEKELVLKHFKQDTLGDSLATIPLDNDQKIFIRAIIELIRNNVDNENLDSEYLEKQMSLSSSQLYRKIKENFSLSPGDLIRTIRLKYSAELLRKNELTVSEICYRAGFNNRSYFYREFKKLYNTTPKNYQLSYKNKNSIISK